MQVGGVLTASASHALGQSDIVTLKGNWGSGAHKVEVNFLNDAWGGTSSTGEGSDSGGTPAGGTDAGGSWLLPVRDGAGVTEPENKAPVLSSSLQAELEAHRTAGLQAALAGQPELALRVMLHALATDAFYSRYAEAVARFTSYPPNLAAACPGIAGSPARQALAQAEADWRGCWTATTEGYLGRVPKALILDAVREGAGTSAAARLAGTKKEVMAADATALLAGTGWLPAVLHVPGGHIPWTLAGADARTRTPRR